MARISAEDVHGIAALARLDLSKEEADRMARELEGILGYIEQVQSLDTEGIAPMTHAVDFSCPLRADEVTPSFPVAEAMQNAPRHADGFFEVPRIVPTGDPSKGGGS